jgi:GT2 family glycosyltransferase
MIPANDIEIKLERRDRAGFGGYAFDRKRPDRRFTVEALVDGLPVAAIRADLFEEALATRGVGDGCYGYFFALPQTLVASARAIEARIANVDNLPGAVLALPGGRREARAEAGIVEWTGGLRFTGWVADGEAPAPRIYAFLDEAVVAEAPAVRWRHVDPPHSSPQRGFDLHLPRRFADGRVWSLSFRDDEGRELSGSPIRFCAFPQGLAAELSRVGDAPGQTLEAEHFDRLLPGALPFADYAGQRSRFRPAIGAGGKTNWAVVVLDGDGLETTLSSLEGQAHGEWTCVALPATTDAFSFESDDLADFALSHCGGAEWFLFLAPGVALDPDALARFSLAAATRPDASLIYADWDVADGDGSLWPMAHPAFDYERMLEQGYFAAAFALPRATVLEAIQARVGSLFRLANFAFDRRDAAARAVHLPGPAAQAPSAVLAGGAERLRRATLDHLQARGVSAEIDALDIDGTRSCRVRRQSATRPTVSIVIPTRNRHDLLANCLESIFTAAARLRAEIIVVDNDSRDPRSLDYFGQLSSQGVRILKAPGPFNFSRLNNLAAAEARGDYLCFLNNDIAARDNDWLDEMLSRHADESVGAVGAKLLWPSGVIQHGGVTLGVNFSPLHAFRDRIDEDPGYGGSLRVAHECGAVTAACMTTPRALFLETGGFDAIRFPVNFNDVDYCLKLASLGRRIVFTPHAKLLHLESASRGRDAAADAAGRFKRELRALREKWGAALVDDPSYNPILALSDPPYSALAWPPRSLAPRLREAPRAHCAPLGF